MNGLFWFNPKCKQLKESAMTYLNYSNESCIYPALSKYTGCNPRHYPNLSIADYVSNTSTGNEIFIIDLPLQKYFLFFKI